MSLTSGISAGGGEKWKIYNFFNRDGSIGQTDSYQYVAINQV